MTQNHCGGEHKLEQMSKEEGNAVGRADTEDEGQGDIGDSISHPQSNYGSGNKDIMICAEPCGDIKMPPSSISVVALIGERSFETINVPLDVQSDYGQIGPEIQFVSAECAGKLLRHIAGLTALARERAEGARALVSKHQRHMDAILSHRTTELLAIRREMVEYRDGQYKPRTSPFLASTHICGVAGRANKGEHRECHAESSRVMYCGCRGIQFQRYDDNKIQATAECLSQSRSAETRSDIDGEVENAFADREVEDVGVKFDQPPKSKRMRSYKCVSERPEDVIYGTWKRTRSE